MANHAKAKGTAFESMIRDYLRAHDIPAERMPAGMATDRGDLAGIVGWTLELKNYTDMSRAVRVGLADLHREQGHAGTAHGAVVVKRRGVTDPAKQLVIMELDQFVAAVLTGGSAA